MVNNSASNTVAKFLSLVLSATLSVSLVACGPQQGQEENEAALEEGVGHEESAVVLTQVQRQNWLYQHNLARAAVYRRGESAIPLTQLSYSTALESNAQKHADKCIFKHSQDSERQNVAGFSRVGETMFAYTATSSTIAFDFEKNAVAAWVAQRADFNHLTNTCAPGKICGHYTQVVWGPTTQVGCAVAYCPAGTIFPSSASHNAVCQYGTAGNVYGQFPFAPAQ